ncbi:hypothetical protein [Geodermatophilus sp. SYSU D00766]
MEQVMRPPPDQSVRRADVELWLRTVVDLGLSCASVAAHYDAVAGPFRLAYEEELVAAHPCARVTRPKIQRVWQRREVLPCSSAPRS